MSLFCTLKFVIKKFAYFEWKDRIHCQKSLLTKISHVRFFKIGQK